MKSLCPNCEEITDIKVKIEQETSNVLGSPTAHAAIFSLCLKCNEEFCTMEQLDITLENAYSIYRAKFKTDYPPIYKGWNK